MKFNLKRMLALTLAMLMVIPSFAFADNTKQSLSDDVESVSIVDTELDIVSGNADEIVFEIGEADLGDLTVEEDELSPGLTGEEQEQPADEVRQPAITQEPEVGEVSAAADNSSDFEIKNGILSKYKGPGGNVVIPGGVTSISENAFAANSALTSVEIPKGVTGIGQYAFRDCSRLASVTLPEGLKDIGNNAFLRCGSLEISIPKSVVSIGEGAFADCKKVSVSSENKHYVIEDGLLYTSDKKTLIYCPHSILNVAIPKGTERIGGLAFYDCYYLNSVSIPQSVTSIGEMAFYLCMKLPEISIPDSVTGIEDAAFDYCSSLTAVTIPGSVKCIGRDAFRHCESLKKVVIANGVTQIDAEAFAECDNLESVTIPATIESIGWHAFSEHSKVTIKGLAGSIAETYAKDNGLAFKAIDTTSLAPAATATPAPKVSIPKKLTLGVKETYAFDVAGADFKSSNTAVATINSKGVVTAKKVGTATITVKPRNGKKVSVKLKVVKAPTKVTLATKALTLGVQEKLVLEPTITKGTHASYTWSVKSKKVATVAKDGTITGVKAGTTTVTVKTHNGKRASVKVKVVKAPAKVSLADKAFTLGVKEKLVLKPTITKGAHTSYTWSIEDKKVATIGNDGMLTGVKAGTTTVTVKTHNGKKASVEVTVVKAPSKVSFASEALTLGVKEKITLKPTIAEGTHTSYTWSVKDRKIASITQDGTLTGVKAGITTVTVKTHNGKKASVKVTVGQAPGKVTVKPATVTLQVGQTRALTAMLPDKTASNQLKWTSSNNNVVKVNADGVVTAIQGGQARIAVKTFNGKKAECTVTVEKQPEVKLTYADTVEKISEEGIDDSESKKSIREINKLIDDINASVPEYNKAVRALEDDVVKLCNTLPLPAIGKDSGIVKFDFGNYYLNIDEKLLEKLADGVDLDIQETEGNDILMTVDGMRFRAYFSGNVLCIDNRSEAKNATAIPKSQDDKEYKDSKSKLEQFQVDYTKLCRQCTKILHDLDEIEKTLEVRISSNKSVTEFLRVAQVDKEQYPSSKIRDELKEKYNTYCKVLKDDTKRLTLVRSMQGLLQAVDLLSLSNHFDELASRWAESIEIYEHYHLREAAVLENDLLKQNATDLNMYIHRLWWNYRFDVGLTMGKLLSSTLGFSTILGSIINKDVKNLSALNKSLGKMKAGWWAALIELGNYVHGELYKRNYQFMKREDDYLHSSLSIGVTDADTGKPLKDVMVTYRDGYINEFVKSTNTDGKLKLRVRPGSWYLTFELDGYESITIKGTGENRLKVRETIPVPVSLKPELATIKGKVVDEKTEKPLKGVKVACEGCDPVTTDSKGEYVINKVLAGNREVVFTKDKYFTQKVTAVVKSGAEIPLDMRMQPTFGRIEGTVIDEITKEPLSGVSVKYMGLTEATTDSKGKYAIENMSVGQYDISFEKEAFVTTICKSVPVASDETTRLDADLQPKMGTIKGTVTDARTDKALSGVRVQCEGCDSVTTGSSGSFIIENVREGECKLSFSKEKYEAVVVTAKVIGDYISTYTVPMNPMLGGVGGIVKNDKGEPIKGVSVTFGGFSAVTDSVGRYVITDVPVGKYKLQFSARFHDSEEAEVTIVNKSTTSLNVRLIQQFGKVTGVVRDYDTKEPLSDVRVECEYGSAITDSNGRYIMNGVFAGFRTVNASLGRYKIESATVHVMKDFTSTQNFELKVTNMFFGHYEQDNNPSNGKEPIEWIVIGRDSRSVTLLSALVLDCRSYHTFNDFTTWQSCDLRTWLNNDFLNAAFNDTEKTRIQTTHVVAHKNPVYASLADAGPDTDDMVYLLSATEAKTVLPSLSVYDRVCKATSYAASKGYTGDWWLRTPGESPNYAANVDRSGEIDYEGIYVITGKIGSMYGGYMYGVRPVISLSRS